MLGTKAAVSLSSHLFHSLSRSKIRDAIAPDRQSVQKSRREHPGISELKENAWHEGGGFFEQPLVPLTVRLNVITSRSGHVAGLEKKLQMCFLLRRQIREHHAVLCRNNNLVHDTKSHVNRLWLACRAGDALPRIIVLCFNPKSFDYLLWRRGFGMEVKPWPAR